ncbi:MAG TPA: hypothetical protein VMV49_02445 [Candidatus Deferrimicrobium sp.]|nr:hypothetical protein [Candidatus Deferrimicrobium sp.]
MKKGFNETRYGNGAFGQWGRDQFGLPAYEYTCMQTSDSIARTPTSGKDSVDHWHQVGNDRITLTAHNGGYLQFFIADRGLQWISHFAPQKKCYGGGICFIEENGRIWSDLYNSKANSFQKTYKRVFGCGYFQKLVEKNDFTVEHFIYPPFGNDPVVISEIVITNNSNQKRKISVFEFWGIRFKVLIGSLLSMLYMTKDRTKFGDSALISFVLRIVKNLLLGLQLGSEQIRDRFSSKFTFESQISESDHAIILNPKLKSKIPVKKGQRADRNYFFHPIFLAALQKDLPMKCYNQIKIYKKESAYSIRREYQPTTDATPCVMLGHELTLNPHETKCLRFLFGTVEQENIPSLIKKYEQFIQSDRKTKSFEQWRENALHFALDSEPWLNREILWHSYYLRSAALFDKYFDNHYLPQGNAYTFLHGANGAIRDYILFTIPMIYLNAKLAREMLEYIFRTMTPEGELPYAIVGVGQQMGAFVHETSSDLHLFLFWGLLEYLYLTRDFQFLDKKLPFYPLDREESSTVRERIILGLQFLFQKVGIGDHGLIKVGSGDWSDGISLLVKNRRALVKNGESTFNSAFALYIFPQLIDLLKREAPKYAGYVTQKYKELKEACLKTWNGRWFYRGWDGKNGPIGENNLFLEHHVWLLLSGVLPHDQAEILIKNIYKLLDMNAKTGQFILYPPASVMLNILPPGWDVNGGIWHAMNFLLTWAYSKYDSKKAFRSLVKNSMAKRAEIYPNIWYGIWSGSDSYNADYASNPGQTFIHPATPQTDFPIMNLNLHANFLNSVIKLVGINPTIEGLVIDPRIPQKTFKFSTPLLGVEIQETEIKGFYKPVREDHCTLRIKKPKSWNQNIKVLINGQPLTKELVIEKEWILINAKIPGTGLKFHLEHF